MCRYRVTSHFLELRPAHFFENRAGLDLHTFGVTCAGFAQKCAEKPAHFFEGRCALRPWNHWLFRVPAHFRAFSLSPYYSEEEKKVVIQRKRWRKKTRESVQRPDTCTLFIKEQNMSRYELNIYEEPIYVYELDRIFANPDELASFFECRYS